MQIKAAKRREEKDDERLLFITFDKTTLRPGFC